MKKYIFLIISVVVLAGLIGYYIVNRPHTSLQNKKPDFSLTASDLIQEYGKDETQADQKYLDQVLEVSGTILSVQQEGAFVNVVLESASQISTVVCQMQKDRYTMDDFKTGEQISIKGKCTGMLMDVVLVQCVIN